MVSRTRYTSLKLLQKIVDLVIGSSLMVNILCLKCLLALICDKVVEVSKLCNFKKCRPSKRILKAEKKIKHERLAGKRIT